MPSVYRRGSSLVFHRTPDCVQLTKRPKGQARPLIKLDLNDVDKPTPCKFCYPDAPRIKPVRRFCPECNKSAPRPCAHNGGVRVTIGITTNYVSLLRDPGEQHSRTIWVWPDRVHHYEPIAS